MGERRVGGEKRGKKGRNNGEMRGKKAKTGGKGVLSLANRAMETSSRTNVTQNFGKKHPAAFGPPFCQNLGQNIQPWAVRIPGFGGKKFFGQKNAFFGAKRLYLANKRLFQAMSSFRYTVTEHCSSNCCNVFC